MIIYIIFLYAHTHCLKIDRGLKIFYKLFSLPRLMCETTVVLGHPRHSFLIFILFTHPQTIFSLALAPDS